MSLSYEYSAGGVVFRKTGREAQILLCLQQKLSGIKVMCLPKGHIEPGETDETAALREVLEETGVAGSIVMPLEPIVYHFYQQGRHIRKEVRYYLMECLAENFSPNAETEEIQWVGEEQADIANPYPSEKRVIKQAFDAIKMRE